MKLEVTVEAILSFITPRSVVRAHPSLPNHSHQQVKAISILRPSRDREYGRILLTKRLSKRPSATVVQRCCEKTAHFECPISSPSGSIWTIFSRSLGSWATYAWVF